MSEHKLGNFEFNTEEELAAAKKELLLIKTVKEKYDINDIKIAKVVISKFKPKTIIGERFFIQLNDKCAEEDNKAILDTIDLAIKDKKKQVLAESESKVKEHTSSIPRRQAPLPDYESVNDRISVEEQNKARILRQWAKGIIIISCVSAVLQVGACIIDSSKISPSNNGGSNNPTTKQTSDGGRLEANCDYVVLPKIGEVYVVPVNCNGNNILFDNGRFCLKNMRYEGADKKDGSYCLYYTGTMEYNGKKDLQGITVQMTLLDGNDKICGMPSFTPISNETKDYPEGIIKPGDSIDFDLEITAYKVALDRVSKLGLVDIVSFDL